ncbi:hypothetical protein ZWY2020_029218 [Hordeum vulgare]|nr:hypothetical protein ZWY2020_029218 [Hordeum vulgare]
MWMGGDGATTVDPHPPSPDGDWQGDRRVLLRWPTNALASIFGHGSPTVMEEAVAAAGKKEEEELSIGPFSILMLSIKNNTQWQREKLVTMIQSRRGAEKWR